MSLTPTGLSLQLNPLIVSSLKLNFIFGFSCKLKSEKEAGAQHAVPYKENSNKPKRKFFYNYFFDGVSGSKKYNQEIAMR